MPRTKIEKPTPELLKELGVDSWSAWDWSINPKTEIRNPNKEGELL